MTLSVDDQVTLVEAGVILIGIAITWAVYRRPRFPVAGHETGNGESGTYPRTGPTAGRSATE